MFLKTTTRGSRHMARRLERTRMASRQRRTLCILSSSSSVYNPLRRQECKKLKEMTRIGKLNNNVICERYYNTSRRLYDEYPPHSLYPMPALSPTMETGTIAQWTVEEGQTFSAGDVLCSIETDKASVDFEAQDDGLIAKILRQGSNAQDLSVGTPICVVVDPDENAESVTAAFANFVVPDDNTEGGKEEEPVAEAASTPATTTSSSKSILMPSARHLSESKGVDATVLQGSGKGGRVTKSDVLLAFENGTPMPPLAKTATATAAAPPPPTAAAAPSVATPPVPMSLGNLVTAVNIPPIEASGSYEDVPNNTIRKVIARRLAESKQSVPHYYTSIQVELDNALALRKQLANEYDVKVSVNDLIIRCSALALKSVPRVNCFYNEASQSVESHQDDTIDISIAVATDSGLITPIVKDTDTLGLAEIGSTVRELAGRARTNKLQPHEFQGGTFCISNLGMFGMDEFSAVINPPQAAILAVGGGTRSIVPTIYKENEDKQESPTIRTIMTARLSADRRVVDEPTAAQFLSAFQTYLTQPELMIL